MMSKQGQKRRRYLPVAAILLILIGFGILTLNELGIPAQWATISSMRLRFTVADLAVIAVGVLVWLWNSMPADQGRWITNTHKRQAVIIAGFVVLISYIVISMCSGLGILSGIWASLPSTLTGGFGLFLALLSFPASPAAVLEKKDTVPQQAAPVAAFTAVQASGKPMNLKALPPAVNLRGIEHYNTAVKEVYEMLMLPTTTAVALTGFSDNDTSLFAGLVYQEVKRRHASGEKAFQHQELWLNIVPSTSLTDILHTLCLHQGVPLPDVDAMSVHGQAAALLEVLNTVGKSCLFVFEHFEEWLDKPRENSTDIEAFFRVLNSHECASKLLLTCHSLHYSGGAGVYLKEYHVPGLHIASTSNHTVNTLDSLDEHFTKHLTATQRQLLSAFSVYRKEISFAIARTHLGSSPTIAEQELLEALEELRQHHWLRPCGRDHYQIDAHIAACAQRHFMDIEDELVQRQALKKARMKVALHYQHEAKMATEKGYAHDAPHIAMHLEAVWALCQAGKLKKAYALTKREDLFTYIQKRSVIEQQELAEWLQPSNTWRPRGMQAASIYAYQDWIYTQREGA